jgi:hypothetical protein
VGPRAVLNAVVKRKIPRPIHRVTVGCTDFCLKIISLIFYINPEKSEDGREDEGKK